MLISFYGVRGSIASPGPDTVKYGGNTSCVHVRLKSGKHLIFDAGTGIRKLGLELARHDDPLILLLSHGHWDHIQGYPFFEPIYQKDREIYVCQGSQGNALALRGLLEQMDGSNFPVHADDLPSDVQTINDTEAWLEQQDFTTVRRNLNHPGGGYAYRVEEEGVKLAFITDNELEPPNKPATRYDEWVAFCRGVDVLIHDAQYQEQDMPAKHGWGHSLISQVRQLAVDAEVKNLVMFHHDPERSDRELDEIALETANYFKSRKAPIGSYIAAEGMCMAVEPSSPLKITTIRLNKVQ